MTGASPSGAGGALRLLIVTAEPSRREALTAVLAGDGCVATWATPLDAARAVAAEAPPEVALVDGDVAGALADLLGPDPVVIALLGPGQAADPRATDAIELPAELDALPRRVRAAARLAAAQRACRLAEAAAADAELRFRVLAEAGLDAVAVHCGGRVVYANQAFAAQLGYAPDEVAGLAVIDHIAPDDRELVLGHIAAGHQGAYRAHGRRRDGTLFPVEIRGRTLPDSPPGLRVTAFRDLTEHEAAEAERQRARDALARSEARFRQLIEHAPDAVVVLSSAREVLFANPRAAEMLGLAGVGELLGKPLADFLDPSEVPAFAARTAQVQRGIQLAPREWRPRADPTRAVEVRSIPIEFEGVPAVVGFARDITARKQLEAQLHHADRMVSLGTLAAGVAHEINNPLTYVQTNLDFLAPRIGGAPQLSDALADARLGAERVARIVRDLHSFVRPIDDAQGRVDVHRVLRFALSVTSNETRHRAQVIEELAPVPPVWGNEGRLGQVFIDLLVNAAHAVSDRDGDGDRDHIRVVTRRDGDDRVVIEVHDTGSGIEPAIMGRLFEPFFTTKPVGHGTGLGLFVCQGIVAAMGGAISVTSEPGRGSCFRVELPAAPAGPDAAGPDPAPARVTRRRRILIVDDDPRVAGALVHSLEHDHDATAETTAGAALARVTAGEHFDVVLCDLMMPRMSGMDLYEAVRRQRPEQAAGFVFMTGGAFTARARAFLAADAHPRIYKPFSLDALLELLDGLP